jgi:hypothetical protein
MFWIYKCNSRGLPYQPASGDWQVFFTNDRVGRWGATNVSLFFILYGSDLCSYWKLQENQPKMADFLALNQHF